MEKTNTTALFDTERFPQLLAELKSQLAGGADTLVFMEKDQILGTFLSRGATQKALVRKVAEQWIRDPEMLGDLDASLKEQPKKWN
jgi:hypothetical protein